LCDLPAQRIRLHEVGERPLAVDLDDRQPLAVARFELGMPADVDLLELEAELLPGGTNDPLRGRAEMAPLGVVDRDPRDRARGSS
jgi:hypothetical protein